MATAYAASADKKRLVDSGLEMSRLSNIYFSQKYTSLYSTAVQQCGYYPSCDQAYETDCVVTEYECNRGKVEQFSRMNVVRGAAIRPTIESFSDLQFTVDGPLDETTTVGDPSNFDPNCFVLSVKKQKCPADAAMVDPINGTIRRKVRHSKCTVESRNPLVDCSTKYKNMAGITKKLSNAKSTVMGVRARHPFLTLVSGISLCNYISILLSPRLK